MTTRNAPLPSDNHRKVSPGSSVSSLDTELSSFQFENSSLSDNGAEEEGCADDFIFLGQRTPAHARTPTNSPNYHAVTIASLIDLSDDETIVTDSSACVTSPRTSLTWASGGGAISSCTGAYHRPISNESEGLGKRESAKGDPDTTGWSNINVGRLCFSSNRPVSVISTPATAPPTCATLPRPQIPFSATFGDADSGTSTANILPIRALSAVCSLSKEVPHMVPVAGDRQQVEIDTEGEKSLSEVTSVEGKRKCHRTTSNQLPLKGTMCKETDSKGGSPSSYSNGSTNGSLLSDLPNTCSKTCAEKFSKLTKEFSETKDKLFSLSVQMEEQSLNIAKLMEENRRYIHENSRLKKGRSRGGAENINGDVSEVPYHLYNNNNHHHHNTYSNNHDDGTHQLQDRIMALQLHNSELNLCLERERVKRKEAEARIERDEGYIKRLEDSVQTLRGTRVIMDPSTYRQVAEAYMSAKRTPARRPHTHQNKPVQGSDLVCDAPHDNIMGSNQRNTHQPLSYRSSCPTSSSSYSTTSGKLCPSFESQEYSGYPGDAPRKLGSTKAMDCNRLARQELGKSMNPWDYQQLLESLEELDDTNRGAFS